MAWATRAESRIPHTATRPARVAAQTRRAGCKASRDPARALRFKIQSCQFSAWIVRAAT